MPSFACPECGNPLSSSGLCRDCGFRLPKASKTDATARRAYVAPPPCTQAEWNEYRRIGTFWLPQIKAQLAAAAAKHKGSAMPHILSSVATRGIDYDPEAIAEREAIVREGAKP